MKIKQIDGRTERKKKVVESCIRIRRDEGTRYDKGSAHCDKGTLIATTCRDVTSSSCDVTLHVVILLLHFATLLHHVVMLLLDVALLFHVATSCATTTPFGKDCVCGHDHGIPWSRPWYSMVATMTQDMD